jgi:hypothetical protein
MTVEPKNEEQACLAVMSELERRAGVRLAIVDRPDKAPGRGRAVEIVCEVPTTKQAFAIEHTRIESFTGQIADGYAFTELLGPLERELDGELPGHYWLVVDVGATLGIPSSTDRESVRRALAKWITITAPQLDAEVETEGEGQFWRTERPSGVPFDVTLRRTRLSGSKLLIMRAQPAELELERESRISEALDRKCPKLLEEKVKGRTSVLVLEVNDLALSNRAAVGEALRRALEGRSDVPDCIYLIETHGRPWYLSLMKEGSDVYPDAGLAHAEHVKVP